LWKKYAKGKGYAGFTLKTLIQDLAPLNRATGKWGIFKGWLVATDSVSAGSDVKLDYGSCKYEERALTESAAFDFLKRMAIDRNCELSGEVVLLQDSSTFNDYGYSATSYWKTLGPYSHSHFAVRLSDI